MFHFGRNTQTLYDILPTHLPRASSAIERAKITQGLEGFFVCPLTYNSSVPKLRSLFPKGFTTNRTLSHFTKRGRASSGGYPSGMSLNIYIDDSLQGTSRM